MSLVFNCPECDCNPCMCKVAGQGFMLRDTAVRSNLSVTNPLDSQVGGDHYKNLAIQPIEFTHKNKLDFLQGNIIKYTTRHKNKNGLEDIKKIIHYAKLIAKLDYDTEL
jgi:hypothetical protein